MPKGSTSEALGIDKKMMIQLLNKAITRNPTYHDIIDAFTGTLRVLTTIDDIEEHCQKFIDALRELEGKGARWCADMLREEWRTAAEDMGYNCSCNNISTDHLESL